jgi:phage terminase large subunit-like protein
LLGEVGAWGTGLLPGDSLQAIERAASPIKDLVDTVRVQHCTAGVPDGVSSLQFKSYKQGRKAFEASFIDLIHDDEEVPLDIHTEQLLRTMDTTGTGTRDGCLYVTFTPLEGLSETVLEYLPSGELPDGPQPGEKHVTLVGWDDVPHLSEASKASLRATIPAYQLDARTRGIPMLGAGAIYPVPEEAYLVDDFPIPPHWLRAYGMDVGWNRTAAVWGAYDRESDRWTLYHEHYVGEEKPTVHAAAIKAPGAWIAGAIDPAARGVGKPMASSSCRITWIWGCTWSPPTTPSAGLYQVWDRLATGRLKVCRSLSNWRKEVKLYHRHPKGHVVKVQDHLMDARRYGREWEGDCQTRARRRAPRAAPQWRGVHGWPKAATTVARAPTAAYHSCWLLQDWHAGTMFVNVCEPLAEGKNVIIVNRCIFRPQ